jgi:hypothetical protein
MIRALVLLVAGAILFELGWIISIQFGKSTAHEPPAGGVPLANITPGNPAMHPPPTSSRPPTLSASEAEQLRAAREVILRDHPDLAAEYKQILDDTAAQQVTLDAAMIKADSQVAPLLAKWVELRKRSLPHVDQVQITQAEWQELRAAQTAALTTNPDLTLENRKLTDQMHVFDEKINAAMAKADPTLVPLIAKAEAMRRFSGKIPIPPPPTASSPTTPSSQNSL